MPTAVLFDLVRAASSTTGTGSLALGAAVAGFKDFTAIPNGTVVTYAIEDGTNREIGRGTVSSSGTALSRDTVLASTNSDALINCSGAQNVFVTVAKEDLDTHDLTAATSPGLTDEVPLYSAAVGGKRKMTPDNWLKILNSLTEDTAPNFANDFVLSYSAANSAVRKVRVSTIIPADLNLTVSELALQVADNASQALFLGSAGNRFADSFKATTYVDTAGATNLNSGTSGLLKPTTSVGSTNRLTGSTPSSSSDVGTGFQAPQAIDGNTGTYWQASGSHDTDGNGWLTFDLGSGNAKKLSSWDMYYPGSTSVMSAATVKASNTGAFTGEEVTVGTLSWTLVGSAYANAQTPVPANAYRYWRLISTAAVNTTNANRPLVYEVRAYETSFNNLTVASTALVAAVAPTTAKLVARVNELDSITLGTDLFFDVSRDGGTTWTTFAMNDRFTSNGVHVLESNSLDISGTPSGTSVKWRCRTANNKSLELWDVYLYWN